MYSERGNDGIERSAEQWFRRYNGKAPETGGARKSRAAKAGDWLDKTRKAWEQTANQALERAAELSREPNVHLGPSRHREGHGAAVQEKLQKAERVERGNRADADERDADSREVARIERELRRVEARLKETYDRIRRAIDGRIRQAGRAIRAGAEAAERAGEAIGRAARGRGGAYIEWSKTLGEHVTNLREQVQQLAEQHADEMKGYIGWSEHMGEQHGRLNAHVEKLTKAYNELARLLDEG